MGPNGWGKMAHSRVISCWENLINYSERNNLLAMRGYSSGIRRKKNVSKWHLNSQQMPPRGPFQSAVMASLSSLSAGAVKGNPPGKWFRHAITWR